MRRDYDWLPYEQQIFSQNHEDGIILTLCKNLAQPNQWAIEIGSGDGVQNMVHNLVENHDYRALGHDMLPQAWHHERYQHRMGAVSIDQLESVAGEWPTLEPDFFSLDIDSYDFWVLKTLLQDLEFRPSVMCLEYLSYYGSDWMCSVKSDLGRYRNWKCGASLAAFRELTGRSGYEFFTCDTMGVNCFFYLPERMQDLENLRELPTLTWAEHPRYVGHVIDPQDPDIESDTAKLFDHA